MTYTKIQWTIIFFTLIIDILWINFSSFSLYYDLNTFTVTGLFILAFYIPCLLFQKFRPDPNMIAMLMSICLFFSYVFVGIIFSYLAYTTNQPLITSALASIDHSLGFNDAALVYWFHNHQGLNVLFLYIYCSLFYQNLFTLLYLAARGKIDTQQSFIMQYMIAGFLAIFIGAALPAVGTYEWYHFTPRTSQIGDVQRLYELRQHIVDLTNWNGIVEFPSFHTAAAVLIAYAFRNESKFVFIPILILNILMIFSCLSHGGHFLICIIGGVGVAAVAIGIDRIIFKFVTNQLPQKITPMASEASQTQNTSSNL